MNNENTMLLQVTLTIYMPEPQLPGWEKQKLERQDEMRWLKLNNILK